MDICLSIAHGLKTLAPRCTGETNRTTGLPRPQTQQVNGQPLRVSRFVLKGIGRHDDRIHNPDEIRVRRTGGRILGGGPHGTRARAEQDQTCKPKQDEGSREWAHC